MEREIKNQMDNTDMDKGFSKERLESLAASEMADRGPKAIDTAEGWSGTDETGLAGVNYQRGGESPGADDEDDDVDDDDLELDDDDLDKDAPVVTDTDTIEIDDTEIDDADLDIDLEEEEEEEEDI